MDLRWICEHERRGALRGKARGTGGGGGLFFLILLSGAEVAKPGTMEIKS